MHLLPRKMKSARESGCLISPQRSEGIHLRLRTDLCIVKIIILFFNEHVLNDSDREKIQIPDGNTQLNAAEQEERSCQAPLCGRSFFLDTDCVCTFRPQSSMISGSTW